MSVRFIILISVLTTQSHADDAPLLPREAAKSMIVPKGFSVSLVAGEPDVRQPIGFCIDDRGRIWVAEAYNYPLRASRELKDRILVFEDTSGDGRFDRRTVFYDKLNYVTGIEVGFGGVWIISPPSMLFIPDRNGDAKPDGPAKVLLDGFGNTTSNHNIANGFTWGPDGWLYAGHGRTSPSDIGKPGTPKAKRIHFDGGVYRYHPTRHVFEEFADGTTNPWGVDFDDYGQAFVSNCVNPHLYHVIQGAHYDPWRNRKSSQHAYLRIPTIADHLHWSGSRGGDKGTGFLPDKSVPGGGHAHCGMMVYLGDSWPDRYRNTAFMCNVHGRRINNDMLRRKGSGYTASHAPDVLQAKDPWFMGVTLRYGPDGSVFVSDWSDTGECHSYRNTRRETGRIYKITYGTVKPVKVDIARLSDAELVRLQLHKNDWHVRHARRVLQERAARGELDNETRPALLEMLTTHTDITRRLRALWALHVTGGIADKLILDQLNSSDEYLRAWAIQLELEDRQVTSKRLNKFVKMARTDPSPLVRLYLASGLQRLPLAQRWDTARELVKHGEDSGDANLPLMIWYGIEPLVAADPERGLQLVLDAKMSLIREHIARRVASLAE